MKPHTLIILAMCAGIFSSCYTKLGHKRPSNYKQDRVAMTDSSASSTYSRHRNFGRTGRANPTYSAPKVASEPADSRQIRVLKKARSLLGSPYRYGGNTPKGFDCSGFSKYVFDNIDIDLPRTSRSQGRIGKVVPRSKARPGDLIFFANSKGIINHVGIVLSADNEELMMIHAGSKGVVTVDINRSKYWRPRYKSIRRVIH